MLRVLPLLLLLAGPAWAAPPGGGPPPGERMERLREREAEILEAVRESAPDQYERLVRLKEADPEAYLHQMRRIAHGWDRLDDDPEAVARRMAMVRLDGDISALAEGFDALAKKEQDARRAQMIAKAGELFELRQAERRQKLAHLEAKLAELRAEIDERERRKAEIVEEFVDDRLGGGLGL